MTTRDARDAEARGAERDAGDTNDELAGEDAKVRAMRSVWLAMRAEEPSSGGLAELMAAARGAAAEMAPPPPWWQRVAAGLRRPPVLAFATVLVLLGGALVVGRRLEREGAPTAHWASEPQRTRPEVVGGAVPAAGLAPAGHGALELEQTRMAPPPPAPEPVVNDAIVKREVAPAATSQAAGEDKLRVISSDDQPRSPPSSVAPSRRRPKPKAVMAAGVADPPNEPTTTLSAGAVVAPALDRPGTPALDRPGTPALDRPGTLGRSAAPALGRSAAPAPAPSAATSDGSKLDRAQHAPGSKLPVQRGATPPALYRQCEAAATRGDCAEVRRLVDQISTTDRRYRARVAPATPIAKCLGE